MTHEGGCLCGAVRFTVRGPLREILVCHCVECRVWAGRAWAATAARNEDLEIAESDALTWRASPRSEHGADRGFCNRCGSSLFWRVPGASRTSLSAGALDDPGGLRVAAHIWVEQGLGWERPDATVPHYPRGYPSDAPAVPWALDDRT
jgi:hypothetical protein